LSSPPPTTFYLVGPTASGKTALALALAAQIDGEIVNADLIQGDVTIKARDIDDLVMLLAAQDAEVEIKRREMI
jgi:ATP-dependent protease Clp ATPase subunit